MLMQRRPAVHHRTAGHSFFVGSVALDKRQWWSYDVSALAG